MSMLCSLDNCFSMITSRIKHNLKPRLGAQMRPLVTIIFASLFILSSSLMAYEFEDSEHLLKEAFQREDFSLTIDDEKKEYTEYTGSMRLIELINPVSDEDHQLLDYKFLFFLPQKISAANLIIVTPTIGGVSLFEKTIARRFAKAGYPVLIPIERKASGIIDKDIGARMERQVRRAMAASFHEIEALKEKYSYINTDEMGAIGASLGGIRSSILFSLDNRFKVAFIAVAGANIPLIYRDTQLEQLVISRNKHKKFLNLSTNEEYTNYLSKELYLDPYQITKNKNLQNVAMVISNDDTTVPTLTQWNLFTAIKEAGVHPKTFTTNGGHGRGAFSLILKKNFILDWFKKRL